MDFESWRAFYQSDLQSVYALWIVPAAFFVYWLASAPRRISGDPPRARFVRMYAGVFCVETLIDPFATGPLVDALGLGDVGATAMGLAFVLLGDFRVYLLVFAVASPRRRLSASFVEAALWTPIVAVSAFAIHAALGAALGGVADQLLWMIHELAFVAICFALRAVVAGRSAPDDPHRRRLQRVIAFVMLYYGLWAGADALILFGGFDWGWGVRVIPNQLYYAVWVPFVYAQFFDWRGRPRS